MQHMDSNTARDLPSAFRLASGNHSSFDEGACLMEAVAYVAGEPHSDHPRCACPVLTRHGIRLNDRFSDEERQLLAPLIPRLVGTRADRATQLRRVHLLVDASIREITPMAYEAVGWGVLAAKLRAIGPIVDEASARAARVIVIEVRDEAYKRKAAAYADAAYAAAADAADAADADADAADAAAAAADAADAADADADAADAAAAAADAAADAADAADADAAAAAAAYAAAAAADADADAADAAADAKPAGLARRKVVEASIAAFARAIEIR
jgi:hypothetical protein